MKSYFGKTLVSYLGFIINKEGVHPYSTKVQALSQWPTPHFALELKIFLCGINFYQKFVAHFSHLDKTLHQIANQTPFTQMPLAQK